MKRLNWLVAASAFLGVAGMVIDSMNEKKLIKEAVNEHFKELEDSEEEEG